MKYLFLTVIILSGCSSKSSSDLVADFENLCMDQPTPKARLTISEWGNSLELECSTNFKRSSDGKL